MFVCWSRIDSNITGPILLLSDRLIQEETLGV